MVGEARQVIESMEDHHRQGRGWFSLLVRRQSVLVDNCSCEDRIFVDVVNAEKQELSEEEHIEQEGVRMLKMLYIRKI